MIPDRVRERERERERERMDRFNEDNGDNLIASTIISDAFWPPFDFPD
jgi:hypothetical protein